ncbi:hypothetical protein NBRC116495_25200 [Aurantivibrio plasticivorans]
MESIIIIGAFNLVFVFFSFLYIHGKWVDVSELVRLDPIKGEVKKSSMRGAKNLEGNFEFEFEYQVKGRKYTGHVDTLNIHDFKAFTKRHPVGSYLDIWVSPKKPNFVMHENLCSLTSLLS